MVSTSVPEGTSKSESVKKGTQKEETNQTHVIRREANAGETYDLELPCCVNNKSVKMVIDTGAVITVLNKNVYDLIPAQHKPELKPVKNGVGLQSADGFKIRTYGTATVDLAVDNMHIKHNVFVADITDDGLLGMNFLKDHRCDLSFEAPAIKVRGKWLKLQWSNPNQEKVARVVLSKDTTIQNRTQKVLPAKVSFVTPLKPFGVIEPVNEGELKYNVRIGRSMVDSTITEVGVPVTNNSGQHTKMKKGTVLGYFHPADVVGPELNMEEETAEKMESVKVVNVKDNASNTTIDDLPSFLHDLFERSSVNLNDEQRHQFLHLLIKHSNAFAESNIDLGTCNVAVHSIDTGTSAPIKQQPRRIPFGLQNEALSEVESMTEKKVIRPSNSPWSSPVVLVRKKDNSLRFCIDFRKLNMATKMDAYPLPRADACLDELAGCKFFSCMDLISGYWQLAMDEESIPKTAFSIPGGGHFEFLKMPFGLCGAPATFQRAMDVIMSGMQFQNVLIYLDDIILFTSSFDLHLKVLENVLVRLKKAGLKLKPKKCCFFQLEVHFLGHVVNAEGVSPDPQKVEKVKKWPRPGSVSEIKAFLGLASYYRRFIKDFAHIAAPMNKLMSKETVFKWSQECENAFTTLKQCLTSPPVMGFPQKNGGIYVLDTDASAFAVGGILSQEQQQPDGSIVERVIAYASNSLNRAQRNYCTTRRELFAVKHFCEVFKHYLIGRQFKVRTDHASLRWLMNFKAPEGILARWLETLQQFSFTIEFRSGKLHSNADSLSRIDPKLLEEAKVSVKELPCGPCKQCIKRDSVFNSEEEIQLPKQARRVRQVKSRTDENNVTHCSNWYDQCTVEDLKSAQRQDADIAKVIEWMERESRPSQDEVAAMSPEAKSYWISWDLLTLEDGILYKKFVPQVGKQHKLLYIVPHSFREEVLHLAHNNISGGHLGIHKTVSKIKMKMYWYKLRLDVKLHIAGCAICQTRKNPSKKIKLPMHMQITGSPMDRIDTDLLGKFPVTERGNQYVLVVTDNFSKFVEAYPIPDQRAETIADTLVYKFFSSFGTAYQIHSDQGSGYESKLFKEICELYGIHKTRSSPAHPESNGQCERFNSTLCDMVSKFVSKDQEDWDKKIPLLTAAYRSCEHPKTKFTPNRLFFGRELNTPLSLKFPIPEEGRKTSTLEFVKSVEQANHEVFQFVRDHLRSCNVDKDITDNVRLMDHKYEPGSLVYWFDKQVSKGLSSKLALPWKGPFVIIEVIGDCLYKIVDDKLKKSKVVHHSKLKICKIPDKSVPGSLKLIQNKVKMKAKIKLNPKKCNTYTHSCKTKELEVVQNLGKSRNEGQRPVKLPSKFSH